jgi:hypothetical protein
VPHVRRRSAVVVSGPVRLSAFGEVRGGVDAGLDTTFGRV